MNKKGTTEGINDSDSIELNKDKKREKIFYPQWSEMVDNSYPINFRYESKLKDEKEINDKMIWSIYPSDESRIPWRTDLKALAAVALMHTMNPNKWKPGSPCHKQRIL